MNLRFIFALLILSVFSCAGAKMLLPATEEEALSLLDSYVSRKTEFLARKNAEVDSIRRIILTRTDADASTLRKLADRYHLINTDSALYYYQRAADRAAYENDQQLLTYCRLQQASLMPVNAIIRESVELYESIARAPMDSASLAAYYEAGNRLYLYAESFYTTDSLSLKYHTLAAQATDSLTRYLPQGSAKQQFYSAQAAHNRGDIATAVAGMRRVLVMVPADNNLYARAAAELADIIAGSPDGEKDRRLYYLILAAIGDIAAGTRETTALQSVGIELYKRGDFARAYRFLNISLDDAIHSRARIRTLQVAETLPVISRAYSDMADRNRRRLVWLSLSLVVVTAALSVFIFMVLRQRKKMHRYEMRMERSLIAKDEYVGRILSLCSNYIEGLEDFNRLSLRKIKAGQVSELYDMISSGKILREQTHKFHELFDAAFTRAYPDFAREVDALLLPDKRLAPDPDGHFSPEMRMLAFMRLGITDSQQLARFLGLSLNTVYTYRNKLRNRAIDRDTFESDINRIGRIEKEE